MVTAEHGYSCLHYYAMLVAAVHFQLASGQYANDTGNPTESTSSELRPELPALGAVLGLSVILNAIFITLYCRERRRKCRTETAPSKTEERDGGRDSHDAPNADGSEAAIPIGPVDPDVDGGARDEGPIYDDTDDCRPDPSANDVTHDVRRTPSITVGTQPQSVYLAFPRNTRAIFSESNLTPSPNSNRKGTKPTIKPRPDRSIWRSTPNLIGDSRSLTKTIAERGTDSPDLEKDARHPGFSHGLSDGKGVVRSKASFQAVCQPTITIVTHPPKSPNLSLTTSKSSESLQPSGMDSRRDPPDDLGCSEDDYTPMELCRTDSKASYVSMHSPTRKFLEGTSMINQAQASFRMSDNTAHLAPEYSDIQGQDGRHDSDNSTENSYATPRRISAYKQG